VKGDESPARKTARLAFAFPFNPGKLSVGWTDVPLAYWVGSWTTRVGVFGVSHHGPYVVKGIDER
jgi:hypothetical protein